MHKILFRAENAHFLLNAGSRSTTTSKQCDTKRILTNNGKLRLKNNTRAECKLHCLSDNISFKFRRNIEQF